ncbi:MAG: DUF1493 family protein [Chitinophagaceae bacterium]
MHQLVQRTVGGQENINLRASLNFDLGVADLDWDMFLEQYEKEFNTRLQGLNYNEYFSDGLTYKELALLPLRLVWLLFLFLPARFIGFKKDEIAWYREQPQLTIGDLVLSAIAHRFVRRDEVTIKI